MKAIGILFLCLAILVSLAVASPPGPPGPPGNGTQGGSGPNPGNGTHGGDDRHDNRTHEAAQDGIGYVPGHSAPVDSNDERFQPRTFVLSVGNGFIAFDSRPGHHGDKRDDHGSTGAPAPGSRDSIRGVVSFQAGSPPSLWEAYRSDDSSTEGSDHSGSGDAGDAASFVSKVYDVIYEFDAAGNLVSTVDLSKRTWVIGAVQTSSTLQYVVVTSTDGGFTISFTVSVSAVPGVINGNVTITPRVVETYLDILNYPYGNPTNNLVLSLHIGHALDSHSSSSSNANGTVIQGGSGFSQGYYFFANNAQTNGGYTGVNVTHTPRSSEHLNSTQIANNLKKLSHFVQEVIQVNVTFVAGAANITYDPTIGFASPSSPAIYATGSSSAAAFVAPSFVFLLVAFFLALLA